MEENESVIRALRGELRGWDGVYEESLLGRGTRSQLTWEQAVRVLRKHRWFLIAVVSGLMVAITATALLMRDVYQPVATLEIDPLEAGIKTLHEIESPTSQGDPLHDYLDTQIQILQSEGLAMRAIRALKLDRNPEFAGKQDQAAARGTASQKNPKPVGENSSLQEQLDLADPTGSEASALQTFHRNLSVNPIRNSRLVEVSFASHDPRLAQAVTNTLVSQFIDQNYRDRYVTTMETSGWLSGQLNDLRQKVSESNQIVADYQKKYGLVESDERDAPLVQLMAEVSRQFSDAQADRIQAEAYVRMIDLGQPDGIPSVRNDLIYQNLLTRYADVQTQLAQAQAVYGDENTNVKKLQSQAKELATQVDTERARLISKVRTSLAAAEAREQMMLQSRDRLRTQMSAMGSHLVEYRMLKSEAMANTALYNTLQARLKEAGIYAGLRSSNIRVVDMAPKLHRATSPHRMLIIAIGAPLSLLIGLGLVFVRESFDNTVRIPDDITTWLRLPSLAVLPTVGTKVSAGRAAYERSGSVWADVEKDSRSMYPKMFWSRTQTAEAEAIRALRTALLISGNSKVKVILVSSATEGEGKTTIAINLASVLAQQSNTCLVEGDLRRPMIERALGLSPQAGLREVLEERAPLSNALIPSADIPGLTVLPVKGLPDSPADLLASVQMRNLIGALRQSFGYVVIDSPPIIPFSDARSLGSLSDAVILVSRYGSTTRRAVTRGAELLAEVQAPLKGVVINDVDLMSADFQYFNYGYSWGMIGRRYHHGTNFPLPPAETSEEGSGPEKSKGAHA